MPILVYRLRTTVYSGVPVMVDPDRLKTVDWLLY
jgi:hypothetical protein